MRRTDARQDRSARLRNGAGARARLDRVAETDSTRGTTMRGWQRARRDPVREPMLVYEVHLGSWRRVAKEDNRMLTYRELAPLLAEHW